MSKRLLIASIFAATVSLGAAAQAQTLRFIYREAGGYDLSFEQLTTPAPTSDYAGVSTALPVTEISSNSGSFDTVEWRDSAVHGGFAIDNIGLDVFAPQVDSGTEKNPVFAPGVFVGRDQGNGLAGTLIASLIEGAPEPASWALMILGIGLFGAGLRARKAALAAS